MTSPAAASMISSSSSSSIPVASSTFHVHHARAPKPMHDFFDVDDDGIEMTTDDVADIRASYSRSKDATALPSTDVEFIRIRGVMVTLLQNYGAHPRARFVEFIASRCCARLLETLFLVLNSEFLSLFRPSLTSPTRHVFLRPLSDRALR